MAVLLMLVPALPVQAQLPEPVEQARQAYCTLLLHTMVNGETVGQCIDSLLTGDADETASAGCPPPPSFGVYDTGDRSVQMTPLLAINSPWDGEGIRSHEAAEGIEYNAGFEFGPVEAGIDFTKTDVGTKTIHAWSGETVVYYQEIEWGKFALYVWEFGIGEPECHTYDFWAPTDYTPFGASSPKTREWLLSVGTAAYTDADNDLLPTADPDYVSDGSPPTMSLDIRYKHQDQDHCPRMGGGFSIGTKNTWRGDVGFNFGGAFQGGVAYGHSESDNWEYKFNDNHNCYYYDYLGVDGQAKAGVAFHTYKSPDFGLCSPDGSDCCETGAWDNSEGKCCDPEDEDDFDCQDTVSEHCSPHVVNSCEELEETLTEAVGSLGASLSCDGLGGTLDGVADNLPAGSPDPCSGGKGALPRVQVCGFRFGDPEGEPLVFDDPVLCNRPSPCTMFDEPDLCDLPDPCELPLVSTKVECGLPGLCDGGDVDGFGSCDVPLPTRSIPPVIVCGHVVFAGRGDGGGAIVIENEAVCLPDDE